MHIISRQVDEGVVIGDDLEVTVLEIHEDHVRLAFSCTSADPAYWEEVRYVEHSEAECELQVH